MKINILERCQKVSQCLKESVYLSRRGIAKVLGISKSSVQRHLTSQFRRQQYPKSHFWETAEGQNWLRLLVFGVIYCFGSKGGVGADSLSTFFHMLRLDKHIGCSPSALRNMKIQVKAKIIEYEQEQSKACQRETPISICVGSDETFFGLPILVAIELSSGFSSLYAGLTVKTSPNSEAQLLVLQKKLLQTEKDHQDYQASIHALSQSIHPFHIETGESQMGIALQAQLQPYLSVLEQLSQTYSPTKSQAALDRWKRQIPCWSGVLHAWWQWTLQALYTKTQDPDIQNWVLNCLLPWVYWHQQTEKTRQPKLKQNYEKAARSARERFLTDDCTKNLTNSEQQEWIDWSVWMCTKFQRTSSAVEGRNGYLSGLHHSGRGFTAQTLKALTIIHNFDIKRDDGTTAAQRLFEKPFPDLFEWVVPRMGELPRPRRTLKTPKSKKPTP
jgi:hypothetical protein